MFFEKNVLIQPHLKAQFRDLDGIRRLQTLTSETISLVINPTCEILEYPSSIVAQIACVSKILVQANSLAKWKYWSQALSLLSINTYAFDIWFLLGQVILGNWILLTIARGLCDLGEKFAS